MVSAAEQLVANLNFAAFAKADELKKRILFTLGALIIYRLGTYIPIPGINPEALAETFRQQQSGLLGMFNMLSGGAIGRMAIFALNIMPYISASIIIQLLTTVSPHLEQLKKEGEQGRRQINQYTRYGTVFLAALQAYGIALGLEGAGNIVADPGWFFRLTTVITLVGGTVFLMWLGEQITARGVGNGISLIIFAGIIAELPAALVGTLELGRQGALSTGLIISLLVMAVAVVAFIVGYAAYRSAVGAAASMGSLMRTYFDYHRDKVLAKFSLKRPDTLEDEKIVWYKLGAFLRRGESFYFPEEAEAE
jgi:preprotein translocase subunit SecY